MSHLSKFTCIVFGAAVLFTGCTGKDGAPGPTGTAGTNGTAGPTGPSGQNLTGNLTGFVNSVDETGAQLSKAGVLVTLDGATPAVTATSDVDGRFTLTNVRNGTYNLIFGRAGYGTFRRLGVGHVGGDQPTFLGVTTLSQVSTQTITSIANGTPSPTAVSLNLTFASPTPTTTFRYALFASSTPNPTAATAILVQNGTVFSNGAPTTTFQFNNLGINRAQFNNAGFASGATVYLIMYGSTSFLTAYLDTATGRFVYPVLNPVGSPVLVTVIP